MDDGQNDELQEQFNELANEVEAELAGEFANAAADVSLRGLALLGAWKGPVTPEYQRTVAKSLVFVLMALAAPRRCIEEGSRELNDGQRLVFLARLVCDAFRINHDQVIMELLAEVRSAKKTI